jgi:hypothetical protein
MIRRSTTYGLPPTLTAVVVLLSACSDDTTAATDDGPHRSPSSASPPPLVATLPAGSRLDPGPYALAAIGAPEMAQAVVTVPSGFEAGGDFLFSDEAAIGYWAVSGVYRNPCTKQGGLMSVGRTVDDLATALASQPLIPATEPVPISIGGHDGAYLELTAPRLDYDACTPEDVAFWRTENGDRFTDAAGKFDRVWILDVDGDRVLINAAFDRRATVQEIQALTTVVESVEFTGPNASSNP